MNKIAKVMTTTLAAATIAISAGAVSASAEEKQTAKDTQLLNEMGVCSETDWSDPNKYCIDGKQVTQKKAYAYTAQKLGKPYDENTYFPEIKTAPRFGNKKRWTPPRVLHI